MFLDSVVEEAHCSEVTTEQSWKEDSELWKVLEEGSGHGERRGPLVWPRTGKEEACEGRVGSIRKDGRK